MSDEIKESKGLLDSGSTYGEFEEEMKLAIKHLKSFWDEDNG